MMWHTRETAESRRGVFLCVAMINFVQSWQCTRGIHKLVRSLQFSWIVNGLSCEYVRRPGFRCKVNLCRIASMQSTLDVHTSFPQDRLALFLSLVVDASSGDLSQQLQTVRVRRCRHLVDLRRTTTKCSETQSEILPINNFTPHFGRDNFL